MSLLFRTWAIFVVAVKRLLSQPWMALATALGLVASVALTMSVPLYADAVYYRLLREELSWKTYERWGIRSPFAFVFRYVGSQFRPVEWEDLQPADAYLSGQAGSALRLPQRFMVRYFETDSLRLFSQEEDITYENINEPLTWASFAFASDLEDHIIILEGDFPAAATPSQHSTVEVLVSEALATEVGLRVDEAYTAFHRRKIEGGKLLLLPVPVSIAGVWRAKDPQDDFWFHSPETFSDVMFVPEGTFLDRLSPYMDNEGYLGVWYLVMDGSDVHSSDVVPLLARITAVQQRASALLPNTSLDVSPVDALQEYRRAANLLTILLCAFSAPIIGLTLVFVGLVVGLSMGRQRNEIAVLRSRGATAVQVVGIAALEGMLLGVIAVAVGVPVGELLAHLIGKAHSFLDFTAPSNLRVGVTMETVRFGVAAAGLALVAQVVPTIGAAHHTIVTYKQERARALRPPRWQRAWLDVLLLIPVAYGAYLLWQQGSIALPVADGALVSDPFQNPLLFLVPALGIFALTLFFLRILPVCMAAVAWVASHIGGVGFLLAARHLARTPRFYTAPLMILVLTLSLSAFTASLAQTLDHHLYDQTYYQVGADMDLAELGGVSEAEGPRMALGGDMTPGIGGGDVRQSARGGSLDWLFLPMSEYLKVPGVRAAARVGQFKAFTQLSGGMQSGMFIGVDRIDFPQVAFWRRDFASVSLGALMNALASAPNGVLVPRSFLGLHALNVGDGFHLVLDTSGQPTELDVRIVGVFDLFPTWYAEDRRGRYQPLFVGNLDYLFEQAGGQFPYHVWLKKDPHADYDQIVEGLRRLRLNVVKWAAPLPQVHKEQQRPERQGLFGLLSVGFMAAAFLTVLGLLLYAIFSFRRRFIELGILRAIGLSVGQMMAFLAWELAFLMLLGLVVGTGLGVWASELFIPYLQVGAEAAAQTPPFAVEIDWTAISRTYVLFGLLFVAALGGLTALLTRIKIFQAVKLGETV